MVSCEYSAGVGMGMWGVEPYHLLLLYWQIIFGEWYSIVCPLVSMPGSTAEFKIYSQTALIKLSGTKIKS